MRRGVVDEARDGDVTSLCLEEGLGGMVRLESTALVEGNDESCAALEAAVVIAVEACSIVVEHWWMCSTCSIVSLLFLKYHQA